MKLVRERKRRRSDRLESKLPAILCAMIAALGLLSDPIALNLFPEKYSHIVTGIGSIGLLFSRSIR